MCTRRTPTTAALIRQDNEKKTVVYFLFLQAFIVSTQTLKLSQTVFISSSASASFYFFLISFRFKCAIEQLLRSEHNPRSMEAFSSDNKTCMQAVEDGDGGEGGGGGGKKRVVYLSFLLEIRYLYGINCQLWHRSVRPSLCGIKT